MSCWRSQLSIRCEHTETSMETVVLYDGFHHFSNDLFHVFIPKQIGTMLCLVSMGFFSLAPHPVERRWTPALNAWNSQVWHLSAHQVLKASIGIPMEKCTTRDLWKEFYLNMFDFRPHCMMTWFFKYKLLVSCLGISPWFLNQFYPWHMAP